MARARCPVGTKRVYRHCVRKEKAEQFKMIMNDLSLADTYYDSSHGFMPPYIKKKGITPEKKQEYQQMATSHFTRAAKRTNAWFPNPSYERTAITETAKEISRRDLIRRGILR